jgi:hypothetical protein
MHVVEAALLRHQRVIQLPYRVALKRHFHF